MSVDCNIILTTHTAIEDVATAAGIALGLPWVRREPVNAVYCDGASITSVGGIHLENCRYLNLDGLKMPRLSAREQLLLHCECPTPEGFVRLLMPPTCPAWVAFGEKLVECFGGKLIPSDTTGDVTLEVPPKPFWSAEDDISFEMRQDALAAIVPITRGDLKRLARYA